MKALVTSNPSVTGKFLLFLSIACDVLLKDICKLFGVAWPIFFPSPAAFLRISFFQLTNRASYLSTLLQGPLLTK